MDGTSAKRALTPRGDTNGARRGPGVPVTKDYYTINTPSAPRDTPVADRSPAAADTAWNEGAYTSRADPDPFETHQDTSQDTSPETHQEAYQEARPRAPPGVPTTADYYNAKINTPREVKPVVQPLRPAVKQPKRRAPGVPVTQDYYTIKAPRGEEPPKAEEPPKVASRRPPVQPLRPAAPKLARRGPGVPVTKDYYTINAPSAPAAVEAPRPLYSRSDDERFMVKISGPPRGGQEAAAPEAETVVQPLATVEEELTDGPGVPRGPGVPVTKNYYMINAPTRGVPQEVSDEAAATAARPANRLPPRSRPPAGPPLPPKAR